MYTEVIAIIFSNTSVIQIVHIMYFHRSKCIIIHIECSGTANSPHVFSSVNHHRPFQCKQITQNSILSCIFRHIAHTSTCSNNSNDAVRNVFVVVARFSRSYWRCDGSVRIYPETSARNRTAKELHRGRG